MPSKAVEIGDAIASGATFYGVEVRTLRVELLDGRVLRLELPPPVPANPDDPPSDDGNGLPVEFRRIIRVLRDSPVPLTRTQVAHRLGLVSEKGRFASDFKAVCDGGHATRRGSEYADDPAKFSPE